MQVPSDALYVGLPASALVNRKSPTKLMAMATALPPVEPVRSLEFYYGDGNVVFQVRVLPP